MIRSVKLFITNIKPKNKNSHLLDKSKWLFYILDLLPFKL